MNISKLLANPLFRLERGAPPEKDDLAAFLEWAPDNLPRKYVRFVRLCDGASGDSPYPSGHIEIWPIDRARQRNAAGELGDLPEFFAFGDDGHDQVFAFDLRQPDGAPVCAIGPDHPRPDEVETLASSFSELLEHIVLMKGRI